MKILILTLPLKDNYGGLLQAYALQTVLLRQGYDVFTDIYSLKNPPIYRRIITFLKRAYYTLISGRDGFTPFWLSYPSKEEISVISKETSRFVNENINTIDFFASKEKPLKKYFDKFDAYVVGSDQVWRMSFHKYPQNYFLSFLGDSSTAKRVAYAVSFGVDNWEGNPVLTKECALLASKFNAISVRENSGIDICRDVLGVTATHVLDPTLLLSDQDYTDLVNKDNLNLRTNKKLMVYILDSTDAKEKIVAGIASKKCLLEHRVLPSKNYMYVGHKGIEDCVYPPVTSWIQGFISSDFVITDSFHGTVFSLLYNKPFIVIANKSRGISRLSSLLKMFNLEDRLIDELEDCTHLLEHSIDYDKVNEILNIQRTRSLQFLTNSLRS